MGMAHHVPNRRGLDDAEINELDTIMHAYDTTRAKAKAALIQAQAEYLGTITNAAEARDDGLLAIINTAGGRGTQSRIAEYLGMNQSYLSLRLRKARARAMLATVADEVTTGYLVPALEAMGIDPTGYTLMFDTTPNDESATPGPKPLRDDASSSSTHNRRRREAVGAPRNTHYDQHTCRGQ